MTKRRKWSPLFLPNFNAQNGNANWEESVRDNGRWSNPTHTISAPGYHTLKIWMVDPAVAVEKIVVNTGGVKPSYLGPPESFHHDDTRKYSKISFDMKTIINSSVRPFLSLPLAFCGGTGAFAQDAHWVGTWGCGIQLTEPRNLPPPPGLTSNTLRQIVRSTIGGKQLRVHFSNIFGTSDVVMNSVHIALESGRHDFQRH